MDISTKQPSTNMAPGNIAKEEVKDFESNGIREFAVGLCLLGS